MRQEQVQTRNINVQNELGMISTLEWIRRSKPKVVDPDATSKETRQASTEVTNENQKEPTNEPVRETSNQQIDSEVIQDKIFKMSKNGIQPLNKFPTPSKVAQEQPEGNSPMRVIRDNKPIKESQDQSERRRKKASKEGKRSKNKAKFAAYLEDLQLL